MTGEDTDPAVVAVTAEPKPVHLTIEDAAVDGKEDVTIFVGEEGTSTGKSCEPESPIHVEPISFMAYGLDWFCMVVGLVLSVIGGAAFPSTTIIFGRLIDLFTKWEAAPYLPPSQRVKPEELVAAVQENAVYLVILGTGTFLVTYIYHMPRQVATRITNDTLFIQDGISDKIPLAASHIATSLSAFIIACIKSWRLTIVLLAPHHHHHRRNDERPQHPVQARILDLYSSAGGLAEEAIAAVRTVVAFNAQKKMSERYNEWLVAAKEEGMKKSLSTGIGMGFLFGIIYSGYSLAFYYGPRLINWGITSPNEVTNVFFCFSHSTFFHVLCTIMKLNAPEWKYTTIGLVSAITMGMVYPVYAIVFASVVETFAKRGDDLRDGASF
ncbi:hypothetical protein HK102_008378, partial [Quaeritorhiza haematococci]